MNTAEEEHAKTEELNEDPKIQNDNMTMVDVTDKPSTILKRAKRRKTGLASSRMSNVMQSHKFESADASFEKQVPSLEYKPRWRHVGLKNGDHRISQLQSLKMPTHLIN